MTIGSHGATRAGQEHTTEAGTQPLQAIIIGAGFGGIGMGIALRRAGIVDFVVLEKAADVGGVWRDNIYPGAACDVPSHLYSFSFEPKPDWTNTFGRQPEILAYLRHCVRKYELESHLRFGVAVARASYDERHALWRVTLADGATLTARMLVSATGQLSRPAIPQLDGIEQFQGRAFHSSRWDHGYDVAGKRVAVIGTGASAVQFVPAIAGKVEQLLVFQRSAAYIIPRADRAYSRWQQGLFRRLPWLMRLHRAWIYSVYESRAVGFTRLTGLLDLAAGAPFRRLLRTQVCDPALREKLTPAYPIGCKRILLSSDYLPVFGKPGVSLVDVPIRRVTADAIETADGKLHRVDAIIYGTGFAAAEFLAPMRITGRDGISLDEAWRDGAKAYLGLTVPGFPNFFMLYGPNTNLGHSSIVYMLEAQIAHVMRCRRAMDRANASAIEVDPLRHQQFNSGLQRRLAVSAWSGCRSWYVDRHGRNSANWPGFTLTYRWLTRFGSMQAYRLSTPMAGEARGDMLSAPAGILETANAAFLRAFLRTCFRTLVGPPFGPIAQRRVVALLAPLMPGVGGVVRSRREVGRVPVEVLAAAAGKGSGAVLYLHGGTFCVAGPKAYRSVTTRLAADSGMPVWVPDYRLAPEHPYPAALDDVEACYRELLAEGYAPGDIVVAGDSAGAALALALALRLREAGAPQPASLMLVSPLADSRVDRTFAASPPADPMLRLAWLEQGLRWYACPPDSTLHRPLDVDLSGLPATLIQVGDQEMLLSDSLRLAGCLSEYGVPCKIEHYQQRWHVFHLQAFYLRSAAAAIRTLARFAQASVAASRAGAPAPGGGSAAINATSHADEVLSTH